MTATTINEQAMDFVPEGQLLDERVAASMDTTHREIIGPRNVLIGVIYLGLGVMNYFTFTPPVSVILAVMAAATGIGLIALAVFHGMARYPAHWANYFLFLEMVILQTDGMAFLVLTNDIMNSYGVFVMILGAGIFASRFVWFITSAGCVVVSWLAVVSLAEIPITASREILLLVSSLASAVFFFFLRLRTEQRISAERLVREAYEQRLETALDEIETLSGLLPICASCKNIRDEAGAWHQVESYVRDHTAAEFTHSMCPDCVAIHHPELSLKS